MALKISTNERLRDCDILQWIEARTKEHRRHSSVQLVRPLSAEIAESTSNLRQGQERNNIARQRILTSESCTLGDRGTRRCELAGEGGRVGDGIGMDGNHVVFRINVVEVVVDFDGVLSGTRLREVICARHCRPQSMSTNSITRRSGQLTIVVKRGRFARGENGE